MTYPSVPDRYQDFLCACAAWFESNGCSAVNVRLSRMVSYEQFRNGYIRQRVNDACREKREAVYLELEGEFGLTRSMVEKIVRDER